MGPEVIPYKHTTGLGRFSFFFFSVRDRSLDLSSTIIRVEVDPLFNIHGSQTRFTNPKRKISHFQTPISIITVPKVSSRHGQLEINLIEMLPVTRRNLSCPANNTQTQNSFGMCTRTRFWLPTGKMWFRLQIYAGSVPISSSRLGKQQSSVHSVQFYPKHNIWNKVYTQHKRVQ